MLVRATYTYIKFYIKCVRRPAPSDANELHRWRRRLGHGALKSLSMTPRGDSWAVKTPMWPPFYNPV